MELEGAKQPPYNTSLVGTVHGAAEVLGIDISTADLFGGSGHAFVMNVHEELCPSGPYCWDPAPFYALCRNIGITVTDLGFFDGSSSMDQRARIEADVRDLLNRGVPCGVVNMDHQLIYGFDDHGFLLAEPWGPVETTPPRLSFETWAEFGRELHIGFYSMERCEPADPRIAVVAGLRFAKELHDQPKRYTEEHYAMGVEAYEKWRKAVQGGHPADHGCWWNGMVWGECRSQASAYLRGVSERFPAVADEAEEIADVYARIGALLIEAADKELPKERKVGLIEEARDLELHAVNRLADLADRLESL